MSLLTWCDFFKAFDNVNHKTLLHKYIPFLLNVDDFWFTNYLSNWNMSVQLQNIIWKINNIAYGVPQHSILGLILFGIYVNGFAVQYAHDTQFLHSNTIHNLNSLIKKTNGTLTKCRGYFLRNELLLSSSKAQSVFIGNRQLLSNIPPNTIKCNVGHNAPKEHVKRIGLYRCMLFDVYINEVSKKVKGILMYCTLVELIIIW